MNPSWERVRIKTKYAEIVRKVAESRDEPFIDALYHIIDTYWQSQRNTVSNPIIPATIIQVDKPVETIEITPVITSVEDLDLEGFE